MKPESTYRERIVAKAGMVLGSREAAESWLLRPAMGLDQQRPLDLLQTELGFLTVEDYLTRLNTTSTAELV